MMKMVILKGGREEAVAAARRRAIELFFLHEVPAVLGAAGVTVGYASAGCHELDRWLVEEKFPRVAGSLLYWSEIEKEKP